MWYFIGGEIVLKIPSISENIKQRKSYTIKGGKVLCFGDLHFSATYMGKHKAYLLECYTTMELIIKKVKEEKPKAIIFMGDIIGVNERNIRDRQFLTRVIMFFGSLYSLTKGNVFVVKGNHDIGDFSDFDMLVGLGYIKNPSYIDYMGDNGLEARFHLVNYGDENKPLQIEKEGASNIVFGHADYYIEGVTTWYRSKDSIELKSLKNFCGVDLVFSGHIHTPSEEILYTRLPDGEEVGLFYVGSPSRVAERYDDCWYVSFEYSKEEASTKFDAQLLGLQPASEVFYEEQDFEYTEEEEAEKELAESKQKILDDIVQEVINSRLATGDLFKQLDLLPADEPTKELAKKYLRQAMEV